MPYNMSVEANESRGVLLFSASRNNLVIVGKLPSLWDSRPAIRFDTDWQTQRGHFAMMGHCRICLQFRNVDENRICRKCVIQEARKVSSRVRLVLYNNKIRLEDLSTGRVISKEDWFYMRLLIDNFYSSVTYDDIDWMNKEKDLERAEIAKRVISGFVYLLKADNGYYKIGRAIDVDIRNKQHMRDYPLTITVVHSFFCRNYIKAESALLKMFADKRLQGEWFALEDQDVEFILNITDEIAQRLF